MIGSFNNALTDYQRKIGAYDKHTWERTLEERVLQGLHRYATPKRVTTVNTELLDLDLIRGSPFTKRKPQLGWIASICTAIGRVFLMPLCYDWWREQASGSGALTLFFLVLYSLQLVSMYVYFQLGVPEDGTDAMNGQDNEGLNKIPPSEVLTPLFMMVILAILQTQIAASGTGPHSVGLGSNSTGKGSRSSPSNSAVPSSLSNNGVNASPQRSVNTSVTQRAYRSGSISMRVSVETNDVSRSKGLQMNSGTSPLKYASRLSNRPSKRRFKIRERNTPSVVESVLETPRPPTESESPLEGASNLRRRLRDSTNRDDNVENRNGHDGRANSANKGSDDESGFDSIDLLGLHVLHHPAIESINFKRPSSPLQEEQPEGERRMSLSERRGIAKESLNLMLSRKATRRIPLIEVTRSRNMSQSSTDEKNQNPSETMHVNSEASMETSVSKSGLESSTETNKTSYHLINGADGNQDKSSVWSRRYSDISSEANGPGQFVDDRRFSDDSVIRRDAMDNGNEDMHGATTVECPPRSRSRSCNSPPTSLPLGPRADPHHLAPTVRSSHNNLNGQTSGQNNANRHNGHNLLTGTLIGSHKTRISHRRTYRTSAGHQCSHRRPGSCSTEEEDEDNHSNDEGTISPATPTKMGASDLDWPMINSENSSEEGEIDVVEEHEREKQILADADLMARRGSGTVEIETTNVTKYPNTTIINETVGSYHFDSQRFSEDIPHPIFCLPDILQDDMSPELRYLSTAPSPFVGTASPSHANSNLNHDNAKNSANRVSCAIWQQSECQKVDLTVLDISSSIVRKVDLSKHSNEYLVVGLVCSFILAMIPGLYRLKMGNFNKSLSLYNASSIPLSKGDAFKSGLLINGSEILVEILPNLTLNIFMDSFFGTDWREKFVMSVAMFERFCLGILFFFLICVAEKTFRQRFLIAKYFCHLTSSRRAKRSDLPHFRLNKVRNIKSWLSIRSYLKKHGPQRSVDIIVSGSFMLAICILTFVCLQLLRDDDDSGDEAAHTNFNHLYCWEMIFADLALGIFIMRLMILGLKINEKYRSNLSILITEQINLYLQQEQKPHKKEELTLANHVLKLAADLLKQLESPFKISGFSANPYLYNMTKVVVLSAFSAVLSELLGFKLKLHKIKITS